MEKTKNEILDTNQLDDGNLENVSGGNDLKVSPPERRTLTDHETITLGS